MKNLRQYQKHFEIWYAPPSSIQKAAAPEWLRVLGFLLIWTSYELKSSCCHGAGNSQRFFEILLGAAYEYYYANSIILCSASNLHLQSKANSKHWSHSILFQSIPSTNMIGNNILMKEWGIFIYLVKLGLSCRTVGRRNFLPTEHAPYVPVLAVLVKIQSLQPKN